MQVALRTGIVEILKRSRKPLRSKEILARLSNLEQVDRIISRRVCRILRYEAGKEDGLVMRIQDGFELRSRVKERLKQRIRRELASQGFRMFAGELEKPDLESKEDIRRLHASARAEKLERHRQFISKYEEKLLEYFADGDEVNISGFWPKLEVVESRTKESELFRYATLLWSVPVSQGFGRRVRFLVTDESNGKLVGLFALGDPVFNLNCRDKWIGWNHEDRAKRLYNVMDIFILGAVPPYNMLLGGKLIAMLATSNEVRRVIEERYSGKETIIMRKQKDPCLALLTTGSALGKSALYNRIKYNGRLLYRRVGETKGWGHFHLNNGLFNEMVTFLKATEGSNAAGNRFGDGPNWKIRTARSALNRLGLSGDLLRHGIRREIWGIPLAKNYDEFLRGETDKLKSYDIPFNDVVGYWKDRWLNSRAKRKPEYIKHNKEDITRTIHNTKGQVEQEGVDIGRSF